MNRKRAVAAGQSSTPVDEVDGAADSGRSDEQIEAGGRRRRGAPGDSIPTRMERVTARADPAMRNGREAQVPVSAKTKSTVVAISTTESRSAEADERKSRAHLESTPRYEAA